MSRTFAHVDEFQNRRPRVLWILHSEQSVRSELGHGEPIQDGKDVGDAPGGKGAGSVFSGAEPFLDFVGDGKDGGGILGVAPIGVRSRLSSTAGFYRLSSSGTHPILQSDPRKGDTTDEVSDSSEPLQPCGALKRAPICRKSANADIRHPLSTPKFPCFSHLRVANILQPPSHECRASEEVQR